MYSHAYPNVLNERDPESQCGTPVGIGPGSLSPHRALISLPPACLSFSSSLFKDSESHMNYVDTLISWLRAIVSSPGSLLKKGLPNPCFVRTCGRVYYSAPCHSTYSPWLTLDMQRLHKSVHTYTHTLSTCSSLHNQHGPNDCLHWLPSLCNYVPIVYFLASYSFKWNSIIIALFNAKVSKSGGCGAPLSALSLSVSTTPHTPTPKSYFVSWVCVKSSSPRTLPVIHLCFAALPYDTVVYFSSPIPP